MKQLLKVSALLFVIAALAFMPPKHKVVGHWRMHYTSGAEDLVDFNANGTYTSNSSTGETTHNGNYKFKGNTISINDKEGCGDTYWATYKITFIGSDSASIAAIADSCEGRKQAVSGASIQRLATR